MTLPERIITSCLHGGFLCVLIAWHETVANKSGIVRPQTMMLVAATLWGIAAAVMLWWKRSAILQQDVPVIPPWYYFLLAFPLCIYASLMPWALLHMLDLIVSMPAPRS